MCLYAFDWAYNICSVCQKHHLTNTFVFPLGAGGKAAEKVAKKREYVKTYMSPWERAMKGNEELMATLKPQMPGPFIYKELPKYKSFNRWGLTLFSCVPVNVA